jgi:hypothetical protein
MNIPIPSQRHVMKVLGTSYGAIGTGGIGNVKIDEIFSFEDEMDGIGN